VPRQSAQSPHDTTCRQRPGAGRGTEARARRGKGATPTRSPTRRHHPKHPYCVHPAQQQHGTDHRQSRRTKPVTHTVYCRPQTNRSVNTSDDTPRARPANANPTPQSLEPVPPPCTHTHSTNPHDTREDDDVRSDLEEVQADAPSGDWPCMHIPCMRSRPTWHTRSVHATTQQPPPPPPPPLPSSSPSSPGKPASVVNLKGLVTPADNDGLIGARERATKP
jgi:hypothetical protein